MPIATLRLVLAVVFITTAFAVDVRVTFNDCNDHIIDGPFDDYFLDLSTVLNEGELQVLVHLVSFDSTTVDERYKIYYPASYPEHLRNFFPDDILNDFTYELPDILLDPFAYLVDGFFNVMTEGLLRFNTTYAQVHLDSYTCADSVMCTLGSRVLNYTDHGYDYTDFDIQIFVYPTLTSCSSLTEFYVTTHRSLALNGYDLLREPTSQSETPAILHAVGTMMGFPESHFEEVGGRNKASFEDKSDMMGTGEFNWAFTNPSNHLRAGWIELGIDVKEITRTGVYRLWPLHPEQYHKGWNANPWEWHLAEFNQSLRATYQNPVALLLDPPEDADGNYLADPILAWIRTDRTFDYDTTDKVRAVYDYSRSILLHRYSDLDEDFEESDETSWIHPFETEEELTDEYLAHASLNVGDYFKDTDAPCSITVLCRDETTDPPSILVESFCQIASDNAVTQAYWYDIDNNSYTIQPSNVFYYFYLDETQIEDFNETADEGGYVSFAIRGSNCEGASNYPERVEHLSEYIWGTYFTDEAYHALPHYVDVAVCFAEFSTGGTDDYYFVEQDLDTYFIKEVQALIFYEKCTVGCDTLRGCDTCTEGFYFDDTCGSCGTDCSSKNADDVCCYSRGNATCFDATLQGIPPEHVAGNCSCECEAGFNGTYCENYLGSVIELGAYFPTEKYEEESFTLHFGLLESPLSVDVDIDCTAELPNTTIVDVASVTFVEDSSGEDLYANDAIYVYDGWAPGVNITCQIVTTVESNLFYSPPSHLYVSIIAIKPVTFPENVVVTNYGDESLTFSWDEIDGYLGFKDLVYRALYIEGVVTESSSGYDYVTNSLGYTITGTTSNNSIQVDSLTAGTVYTFRIMASSDLESGYALSPPSYVIPIESATCENPANYSDCGGCENNGTCVEGNCWCEGFYHGSNCSISGCYEYSGAMECNGRGNCTGSGAYQECECRADSYGAFCERFSWKTADIPFTNPNYLYPVVQNTTLSVMIDNLDYSESEAIYLHWKYGPTFYDDVNPLPWELLSYLEYDVNDETEYTITVPVVSPNEGHVGYVFFQTRDTYYYGVRGSMYNPILTNLTMDFVSPGYNRDALLFNETILISWLNINNSLSTDVELFVKYDIGSEEYVESIEFMSLGNVEYDEDEVGRYNFTVPVLSDTITGLVGYLKIEVRDNFYITLEGNLTAPIFSTLTIDFEDPRHEYPVLIGADLLVNWYNLNNSRSPGAHLYVKSDSGIYEDADAKNWTYIDHFEYDENHYTNYSTTVPFVSDQEGVVGYLMYQLIDPYYNSEITGFSAAPILTTFQINFTLPILNDPLLFDDNLTISWGNLNNSLSEDVNLYVRQGVGSLEEVQELNFSLVGQVSWDGDSGTYVDTVPNLSESEEGLVGYIEWYVEDLLYHGVGGTHSAPVFSTLTMDFTSPTVEDPLLIDDDLILTWSNLRNSLSPGVQLSIKSGSGTYENVDGQEWSPVEFIEFDEMDDANYSTTVPQVADYEGVVGYILYQLEDTFYNSLITGYFSAPILSTFDIEFVNPPDNEPLLFNDNLVVSWENLNNSLSTSVDLYIRYVIGNETDLEMENFTYIPDVEYDSETGIGSYTMTVPELSEILDGLVGYIEWYIVDLYYNGVTGGHISPIFSTLTVDIITPVNEKPLLVGEEIVLTWSNLQNSLSTGMQLFIKIGTGTYEEVDSQESSPVSFVEFDDDEDASFSETIPAIADYDGVLGYIIYQIADTFYNSKITGQYSAPILSTFDIDFISPPVNDPLLFGTTITVSWANLNNSLSTTVDLYLRYVIGDQEDLDSVNFTYIRNVTYDEITGIGEYETTVAILSETHEGLVGYVEWYIVDLYYEGVSGSHISPIFSTFDVEIGGAIHEDPVLVGETLYLSWMNLNGSLSSIVQISIKVGSGDNNTVDDQEWVPVENITYDDNGFADYITTVPSVSDQEGVIGYIMYQVNDLFYNSLLVGTFAAPILSTFTISMISPVLNDPLRQGDEVTVSWENLNNSLSTSVDLYVRYATGESSNLTTVSFQHLGEISYDSVTEIGEYVMTVPSLDEDGDGLVGYIEWYIEDTHYSGVTGSIISPIFSTLTGNFTSPVLEDPVLQEDDIILTWSKLENSLSTTSNISIKYGSDVYSTVELLQYSSLDRITYDVSGDAVYATSVPFVSSDDGVIGYVFFQFSDERYNHKITGEFRAPILSTFTIDFVSPATNDPVMNGSEVDVSWVNLEKSLSESVEFFYRFKETNDSTELEGEAWISEGEITYGDDGIGSHSITVPSFSSSNIVGLVGYIQYYVVDSYYNGVSGMHMSPVFNTVSSRIEIENEMVVIGESVVVTCYNFEYSLSNEVQLFKKEVNGAEGSLGSTIWLEEVANLAYIDGVASYTTTVSDISDGDEGVVGFISFLCVDPVYNNFVSGEASAPILSSIDVTFTSPDPTIPVFIEESMTLIWDRLTSSLSPGVNLYWKYGPTTTDFASVEWTLIDFVEYAGTKGAFTLDVPDIDGSGVVGFLHFRVEDQLYSLVNGEVTYTVIDTWNLDLDTYNGEPFLINNEIVLSWNALGNSISPGCDVYYKYERTLTRATNADWVFGGVVEYDDSDLGTFTLTAPDPSDREGGLDGVIMFRVVDNYYTGVESEVWGYLFDTLTITFDQPEYNTTLVSNSTTTIQWTNLWNSESTAVDLYVKYGYGSLADVEALNWSYLGEFAYNDDTASYVMQVPFVGSEEGVVGYIIFYVDDTTYEYAEGTLVASIFNPFAVPDDNVFDILLDDEYAAYTITGMSVIGAAILGAVVYGIKTRRGNKFQITENDGEEMEFEEVVQGTTSGDPNTI